MAVEREIPLEIDTGFLTVTDLNPIDQEGYKQVSPKMLALCLVILTIIDTPQ